METMEQRSPKAEPRHRYEQRHDPQGVHGEAEPEQDQCEKSQQ
jgi:hypothetical protein